MKRPFLGLEEQRNEHLGSGHQGGVLGAELGEILGLLGFGG